MKRGNLTIWQKLRNKRISKKRAPGERPFSVIKRTFHGDRTYVKNLALSNEHFMVTEHT